MTNNQEFYQELFNSIDPEIEKVVGQFVDACEEIRKTSILGVDTNEREKDMKVRYLVV